MEERLLAYSTNRRDCVKKRFWYHPLQRRGYSLQPTNRTTSPQWYHRL